MHKMLPLIPEEKTGLDTGFYKVFACQPTRYFSAPGRTEISGNHTDHQRGCVLAAAVDLHTRAAAKANGSQSIRILSKGYPLVEVMLTDLSPVEAEKTPPRPLFGVWRLGLCGWVMQWAVSMPMWNRLCCPAPV